VSTSLTAVTLTSSATRLSTRTNNNESSDKRRQRRLTALHKQLTCGARVVRGADWKWSSQDRANTATPLTDHQAWEGTVLGEPSADGWVEVIWDIGHVNFYRMGADGGKYDLALAGSHDPTRLAASHALAVQALASARTTWANNREGEARELFRLRLADLGEEQQVVSSEADVAAFKSRKCFSTPVLTEASVPESIGSVGREAAFDKKERMMGSNSTVASEPQCKLC